jgi:RimJ/RimL family protein N-acetyltransferase
VKPAVRQLTVADVGAYRALRLAALADTPEAFGDSIEDARLRPPAYWHDLLNGLPDRVFFGAFAGGRMVGSMNIVRQKGEKQCHKCMLYGVYVAPEGRGTGASQALMDAVIAAAHAMGILQIGLGVGVRNEAAKRFYQRAGFAAYGTERRALIVDGVFVDETMMVKFLDAE